MELALALKISLLCSVGEKGLYSPRMLGFPLLDGSFSLPCFFNTCRYFLFFFFLMLHSPSCCVCWQGLYARQSSSVSPTHSYNFMSLKANPIN